MSIIPQTSYMYAFCDGLLMGETKQGFKEVSFFIRGVGPLIGTKIPCGLIIVLGSYLFELFFLLEFPLHSALSTSRDNEIPSSVSKH